MTHKIFYLEDDQALAQITIKALKRRDFNIVYAQSINEAKTSITTDEFSHALLDMKLDDGNSLNLVAELVALHPNIKIVLLTGYASIATAVQAIKLGAHNYLPKPATIEEILAAFGETLDIDQPADDTMSLKRLEWEKIQQALADNDGNISLIVKQLNMYRCTL